MIKYLEVMYAEMKAWIADPKCHFSFNGDDQSIHNYLYYSGQLPFAKAIPNRAGGIVNTAGVQGSKTFKQHIADGMAKGLSRDDGKYDENVATCMFSAHDSCL